MKSWSAILIAVLILHLQCSGSCASESVKSKPAPAAAEAPCHQHSGDSSKSPKAPRENNSPCNQGQAIESRTSVAGKSMLPIDAVMPAPVVVTILSEASASKTAEEPPDVWAPPILVSILRI